MGAGHAWENGASIVARGIGRYLQLNIRLFASAERAPRLDQVTLQFSDRPAAETVLAEIWPIAVDSSDPATFTYVIKPTFGPDSSGFDRLEIVTHARVRAIHSVFIAGQQIDWTAFSPEIQDDRLIVGFPPLTGPDANFVPVEVVFEVPVLAFGTEFAGWVFDSADVERIKQGVEPGNATFRFSGDAITVATPLGGDLLMDVAASPNPFTPNGDGANDVLKLNFSLRQVTIERVVSLTIYDLSGRQVRRISGFQYRSGEFAHEWDGTDGSGRMVPPGIYLYKLVLHADSREQKSGTIGLLY